MKPGFIEQNQRRMINHLFNELHAALSSFEPERTRSKFTNIASRVDGLHHDFAIACEERDESGEVR